MEFKKVDLAEVRQNWEDELRNRIEKIQNNNGGIFPCTVHIISAGNDNGSEIYLRNKMKMLRSLGIPYVNHWVPDNNNDKGSVGRAIDGIYYEWNNYWKEISPKNNRIYDCVGTVRYPLIMVQRPLPKSQEFDVKSIICRELGDVDAALKDSPYMAPVAVGVKKIINECFLKNDGDLEGFNATVVGRSEWTGWPIVEMLNDMNATVTVCNSRTPDVDREAFVDNADLVVLCAGQAGIVKSESLTSGNFIIDVGINRNSAGKVVGDFAITSSIGDMRKASSYDPVYYTPVPGGVGPMTVLGLMDNIVSAAERKNDLY